MRIIDSHIHCGVQNVHQPWEDILPLLENAGIEAACLFAPVEDIYDRYDPEFDDDDAWRHCRQQAHAYLLDLSRRYPRVYPYYFVWNDFAVEDLAHRFAGIKWHHHAGEPPYRYDDPDCSEMIDAICDRRLPIVFEETFERTRWFIDRVAGRTAVIIPHLGMLNGGFEPLMAQGIWDDDNVYADTALAGRWEITAFLERYGASRLIFGSDYPFGTPATQLWMLQTLGLTEPDLAAVCGENIAGLIGV
jgi:predicted TIM-barrel fold metal-dependent hydrolase